MHVEQGAGRGRLGSPGARPRRAQARASCTRDTRSGGGGAGWTNGMAGRSSASGSAGRTGSCGGQTRGQPHSNQRSNIHLT